MQKTQKSWLYKKIKNYLRKSVSIRSYKCPKLLLLHYFLKIFQRDFQTLLS